MANNINNNFHILNRQSDHPDVSRAWMWELEIVGLNALVGTVDSEGLKTRIKDAIMPGANIGEIELKYMGTSQFFAGKKTPTTEMTCNFVETEDGYVYSAIQSWMTLIQNISPWNTEGSGSSMMASKRNGYARDLVLTKYTYDGAKARQIQFWNAWPKSLGDGALAYDNEGAVEFSVSFKFDGYEILA